MRSVSSSPAAEREPTKLITNSSAQCVAGWQPRELLTTLSYIYLIYIPNCQPGRQSTLSLAFELWQTPVDISQTVKMQK